MWLKAPTSDIPVINGANNGISEYFDVLPRMIYLCHQIFINTKQLVHYKWFCIQHFKILVFTKYCILVCLSLKLYLQGRYVYYQVFNKRIPQYNSFFTFSLPNISIEETIYDAIFNLREMFHNYDVSDILYQKHTLFFKMFRTTKGSTFPLEAYPKNDFIKGNNY